MSSESVVDMPAPVRMGTFRVLLPLGAPAATYLVRSVVEDGDDAYAIVRKLHPDLASDRTFTNTLRRAVRAVQSCQGIRARVEEHAGGLVFLLDAYEGDLPLDLFRQRIWDSEIPLAHDIAMRIVVDILNQLTRVMGAVQGALGKGCAMGITPDYLFIGVDGAVRLVGLPLAATLQCFPSCATSFRENLYASPESVRGQVSDERKDVWAVGLMAWEFLSGMRAVPLDGGREALRRVTQAGVPGLYAVAPTAPAGLAQVIARACSPSPADRYHTVEDFRRSLVRMCEQCSCLADQARVANFVKRTAGAIFEDTACRLKKIEQLIGELDDLSSWEEEDVVSITTSASEFFPDPERRE